MLIFGECFKTQSDQNIHQNAPNCNIFSKFSRAAYAPEPLKHIYVCNYKNYNYCKCHQMIITYLRFLVCCAIMSITLCLI